MSQDADGEFFPSPAITPGQAGQRAESELETERGGDLSLTGKRRGRKRKRPEAEIRQLQLQVQAMQNTLQELVQARRHLALHDTGGPATEVWGKDPDVLSIAASDSLEGLHDPLFEEDGQSLSDFGDSSSQASEPGPMDPSDKAVIAMAAARAQTACQAPPPAASVFDRGSRRHRSEGLPVLPDFMSELQSSWKAPSSTALPRTQLASIAGAEADGVATAPRVGPTFAMLAGAVARAGRDANHPNKSCRATDNQLRRAYHSSALAAKLACTNSLLLLYLEGLLQDLASAAPSDEMVEMLHVADMLLQGTSAHAQALGQSMASMVQARRQVWLAQSSLSDQDCIAVLAAPEVSGEVFGPPCEAALEQSRRVRELTRSVREVPASRLHWSHGSFPAISSASRAPQPSARGLPVRGSQARQHSFHHDCGGTTHLGGPRPPPAGGQPRR